MKITHHLDHGTWTKFVLDHPQGNIFHTAEMFEVFARAKGHRPTLWAAQNCTGKVLALLLPVDIIQYSQLPKFMSRAIVYGGALWDHSPEGREALSVLLEKYKKKTQGENLFTELRNISETSDIQPILSGNDFAYENHLNYLINLDCSSEAVLQSIGKRTRKHIMRGLRKGKLTLLFAKDRDQVAACYELIKTTYKNAGIPVTHQSLFEAAFDVLYPKGMVQFLLAEVEGIPVAASVELLFKDVIYGWYSGMDRKYTSYTPNELIMWRILSWGAENDYRLYDFGGAGKPEEDYGVRRFKAKFGGDLVNFGRNKYIPFPLFYKFTEISYKISRRVLFT